MRQQGQQNRRGRGRSSGRKIQNPLSRNFDSNGPDVKIRGTASHIAEKYISLARDALSSGDSVAAENLFQHAEHYNRIIMSAQQASQPSDSQPMITDPVSGSVMNGGDHGGFDETGNFDSEDFIVDETTPENHAERQGRMRNGHPKTNNNGTAGNRRRRRRSNNNGTQLKNGAENSNEGTVKSSSQPAPKKENSAKSGEPSTNGVLL